MSATAASRSRALSVGRSVFVAAVAALLLALVGVCASPAHATSGQPGLGAERCDAVGAATATFAYDAWGRRTTDFGSEAGTLGFAGQVTEPGTDLQFLRARYYDPKTAQFISRDAKEVSTGQPYLYAAGNPAMFTDPTGESIFDGLDDFLGGVQSGASFGKSKPGYANRCAWLNFIGQQLGGFADPLRKIRAAGTVGAKVGAGVAKYDPDFAIGQLTSRGAKASDLTRVAESQGWRRVQNPNGPIKYFDGDGVARLTLKSGSARAPGSNFPHVEIRNAAGRRVDPHGNPVARRSLGNHTRIDWDLP